ncbi:F-box/LRR-repeat protein 12, partial [Numida meleagris]|uniref:F-box/LRR-repeat protein 12 n=1 Tax=Numida meleagris TaxID=8996 RepID=UPI000B3DD015
PVLPPFPFPVLSPQLSCRTLWHAVRHCLRDNLRTLRLRGALRSPGRHRLLSPALLAALAARCPRLERLCLTEADLHPLPYPSLPASLSALELSCCEIPSPWFCGGSSSSPLLRRLELRNVPAFSDRHLLNVAVSSRGRLRTLSLSGTYRLTDAGIERAAPHLEELERLELHRCVLSDSALGSVARHAKRLRVLAVTSVPQLTDAGLASLAALQRLETLRLDLDNKFSLDAVVALCRALPRLRDFALDGVRSEDEAAGEIRACVPRCSFSPPA